MEQGVLFTAVGLGNGFVNALAQRVVVIAGLELAILVVFADAVMGVVAVLALQIAGLAQDISRRVEQHLLGAGAEQPVARRCVVVFLALWLAIGGVRLRLTQAVAHSVVVKLLFSIRALIADQPLYQVIAKLLLVVLFSFTAFDAGDVVQPVVLVVLLPDGLLSVVADQNVGGAAIQVVADALGQAVAVGR